MQPARLIADADALSLDEALERAGNRAGAHFGFTDAVRSLQDERAGR